MIPYIQIYAISFVFWAFGLVVEYAAPACLKEDKYGCNGEGTNTNISGWATDIFVGLVANIAVIHLLMLRNKGYKIRPSMILALIGGGIAYYAGALAHSLFANTGAGDSLGQPAFWILWIIGYGALATEMVLTVLFAKGIAKDYSSKVEKSSNDTQYFDLDATGMTRKWKRRLTCMNFFAFLTVLAVAGVFIGGMMNLADADLHTKKLHDAAVDTGEDPTGTTIISYGEELFFLVYPAGHVTFALAVVPFLKKSSQLTEDLHEKDPERVLGVSMMEATIGIPIIQCTIGFLFFFWLFVLTMATEIDGENLYSVSKGPLWTHYAMVLTYVLKYVLAVGIPSRSQEDHEFTGLVDEGAIESV